MKKILLCLMSVLLLTGCAKDEKIVQEVQKTTTTVNEQNLILPLFSTKSDNEDKIWVGTFQLVFNDMKNNIIKRDIEFVGVKPTDELIGLNKEEFKSDMLNESSYYTSYGKISPQAKEEIKKGIKEKFNETSSIIDSLDWSEGIGKFYAYAMLKKIFEFEHAFDKLGEFSFNNSDKKYEFFGINNDSDDILDNNIKVLFYNDSDDYAIQLLTKTGDIVYLYRNDKNDSLKNLYDEMISKKEIYKGATRFKDIDTLKVPNLKIRTMRNYPELCDKQIKGTNLEFSAAIETLEFDLDNVGGKVKSEAIIMTRLTAMPGPMPQPRHFNFDKTFTLYLTDSGKTNPYLGLRINDLSKFIK